MGFWVTVAAYAALYAIHKYTAPKVPKAREEDLGQDKVPTVRDGITIPLWYGMCRFDAPNLVWNSPRQKARIIDTDTTTYASNMYWILGIPGGRSPTNPLTYDRKITFDDLVINGIRYNQSPAEPGSFYSDIVQGFDADENLFTEHDGAFSLRVSDDDNGIRGKMIVVKGTISTNSFGSGEFTAATGLDQHLWPAYRYQTGMLCCGANGPNRADTIRNDNSGDLLSRTFQYGLSPDIPSIILTLTNPCSLDLGGGLPEMLPIGPNPNPIAVLYDILTNDWARVGLPAARIDNQSFSDAAEVLKDELHGWGGMIDDPSQAADIIREIMAQVNGVLYEDPVTRQFKVKLVRFDYDPGLLPVFDESNVGEVISFNVSTYAESYNQVRVTYVDCSDSFQTKTAVEQDLANITAQGGRVRALTLNMPHIREASVAQSVAARELNEVALPLGALKIKVNRDGFELRPGDPFVFSWEKYNLVEVVFRAVHIDLGVLGTESVIIDAIQDAYSADSATLGDRTVPFPNAPLIPIQERTFTESPRYFNLKANAAGFIGTVDTNRALYLASPSQPDISSGYSVYEYDDNFVRVVSDLHPSSVQYPFRAVVETAYGRGLDPYDTSTGLRISGLADPTILFTATALEIRNSGKNMIIVGREIMAYETFTDMGSGVYRLNNVWRGLLDTPTIAHEVGERVYILSDGLGFAGGRYVGRLAALDEGFTANGRFLPVVGGATMGPDDYGVETDRFVSRDRVSLVYPPSDFQVNSTKGATLLSEGVTLNWKPRNRTTNVIIRGNDADEALADLVDYRCKTQKIGPLGLVGSTYTRLTAFSDPARITTTQSGYGAIDCMVAPVNATTLDECWEAPRVTMTCPPWRNLLANAGFADFLNAFTPAWVIVTGGDRISSVDSHGGAGFYITADGVNEEVDVSQTVPIDEFYAERMTAIFEVYVRRFAASSDTYTLTLSALDSGGTTLSSTTAGPTNPSDVAWNKVVLTLSPLPAGTVQLRVRMQADHAEDTITTIGFADACLRCGQQTGQQLTNGNFQLGTLGSWTTVSGTWSAVTTSGYDGNVVAQSTATGTAELSQTIALPTGYEFGTAALTYAIMSPDGIDTDTGQVVLEALNGASAVVATISSATVETAAGVWTAGELFLEDLPASTTQIRVRLIAVTSSSNDMAFDAVSLRMHKQLDPDQRVDLDFRTPRAQARPRDRGDWYESNPEIPFPDYGMFTHGQFIGSRLIGQLGIEPTMSADSGARQGKFVGLYDAESDSFTGPVAELRATDLGIIAKSDTKLYGNFGSDESFSVLCIFRSRRTTAAAHGLCGRIVSGGVGWSLEIDSSGFVQARLEGSDATVTASRGAATFTGAPWMAWLIYDHITEQLFCIDPSGMSISSTVGMGEIKSTTPTPFMIGKAEASDNCLDGQIDVHIWRQAVSASAAQAFWTHGLAPTGVTMTASARTGNVVVPVESDSDGELLAVYAPSQLPYGRPSGTSSSRGLAQPVAATNLAPHHDFANTTLWPREGSPTVTVDKQAPMGFLDAMSITGNNTAGVRSQDFALSATANVHVVFYMRAPSDFTHDMRFQLLNSSGVVKATLDLPAGPDWFRVEGNIGTWDASTANGRIKFFASADGTSRNVEIAGPVFVTQAATDNVLALPYGGAVGASTYTFTTTLPEQYNHEGEIYMDCDGREDSFVAARDVVIVDNGVNNNDNRILRITSSNQAQLGHSDGSAANTNATSGTLNWGIPRDVRGRWTRAFLRDGANMTSAIHSNGTSTAGRTTAWTPSATPLTRTRLTDSGLLISRIVLFVREVGIGQQIP
jgi:hypothetical protein